MEFLNFSLERVVQIAQANVSLSVLSAAPILEPNLLTLQQFNQIVLPLVDQVANLRRKNLNLKTTRDLLLPKFISGEIDVEAINTSDLEAIAA